MRMRPMKLLVVVAGAMLVAAPSAAWADPPMMPAHLAAAAVGAPPAHLQVQQNMQAMFPGGAQGMPGGGGGGMPGFGFTPGVGPGGMMMVAPPAAVAPPPPSAPPGTPVAHATAGPMAVDAQHRGAAAGPVGTRPPLKKKQQNGMPEALPGAGEAAMPSAPDSTIRGLLPAGPKAKNPHAAARRTASAKASPQAAAKP